MPTGGAGSKQNVGDSISPELAFRQAVGETAVTPASSGTSTEGKRASRVENLHHVKNLSRSRLIKVEFAMLGGV